MGRVIDAATSAPVRGATVRLHDWSADAGEDPKTAVITDAEGQFVFGGVPEGDYRLWAEKFGYSHGTVGQRRVHPDYNDIPPTHVDANEHRAGLTIRIWKHGAISGTIVDDFGEPLAGVSLHAYPRVFVSGRPSVDAPRNVETRSDDRGRYRFGNLPAGEYIVGFIPAQGSAPLALAAENQRLAHSGDESAMMQLYAALESSWLDMPRLGGSTHTRIGSWLFAIGQPPAFVKDGRLYVYPAQFYGGTSQSLTGKPIIVRSGEEADGINFTMRPTSGVRVSGIVTDQGGPVANMPVRLTPTGLDTVERESSMPVGVSFTDADGRFMMLAVPPGQYTLEAIKGPPREGGFGMFEAMGSSPDGSVISVGREVFTPPAPPKRLPTLFATSSVTVGTSDVDDVSVVVRNGVRLSGRIEYNGSAKQPEVGELEHLFVRAVPRDRIGGSFGEFDTGGKFGVDGRFETAELTPGFYLLMVSEVPGGWHLDAISANGIDASSTPIEVTDKPISSIVVRFTDKASRLSGSVRVANGERPDDTLVVVFPADRTRWVDYGPRPRALREGVVSSDGTFAINDLPAGAYVVAAVHDDLSSDWRDPAILAKLVPIGTRITMESGAQKTVTLDAGRVR